MTKQYLMFYNFGFVSRVTFGYVVHKNMVNDNSVIGFPLVTAYFEQDLPGIEPGHLADITTL